jgi:hypothetical protein
VPLCFPPLSFMFQLLSAFFLNLYSQGMIFFSPHKKAPYTLSHFTLLNRPGTGTVSLHMPGQV